MKTDKRRLTELWGILLVTRLKVPAIYCNFCLRSPIGCDKDISVFENHKWIQSIFSTFIFIYNDQLTISTIYNLWAHSNCLISHPIWNMTQKSYLHIIWILKTDRFCLRTLKIHQKCQFFFHFATLRSASKIGNLVKNPIDGNWNFWNINLFLLLYPCDFVWILEES